MTKPTANNQGETIATQGSSHAAIATSADMVKIPPAPAIGSFSNYIKTEKLKKGTTACTTIGGSSIWTSVGELGPLSDPPHPGVTPSVTPKVKSDPFGGVKSRTSQAEAKATDWSRDVLCEGNPVVRNNDPTTHNHGNTTGKVILVPDGADLARMAADAVAGGGCAAGDPVDVVTGRAFSWPVHDLSLPGPLPLTFARVYSTRISSRDTGLGFGWTHSFGWEVQVYTTAATVLTDDGIAVAFPKLPAVGYPVLGPGGWLLGRHGGGFILDTNDGVYRIFSPITPGTSRYRLDAVQDALGNQIVLKFEEHRLVQIIDCVGRMVRVNWSLEDRVASLEVESAPSEGKWIRTATYQHDPRGDLVSVTDALGYSWSYRYDSLHRLTSHTNRVGLTFHFVYDRIGRCIETWGDYVGQPDPSLGDDLPRFLADGVTSVKGVHHCRIHYYDGHITEVVDSMRVRRFRGNDQGTVEEIVGGDGASSSRFDPRGFLISRTDPAGARVEYKRDERGRILEVTAPLGRVTKIERDLYGMPVTITDPEGRITTRTLDRATGRRTVTNAAGLMFTYEHDRRGRLTEVVAPDGVRTVIEYDSYANPVALVDSLGCRWRWTYDALGRCITEATPAGDTTRYTYSDRGDLIAVEDSRGGITRYAYDGEQQLVRVTDALGHVNTLSWGGNKRLCSRTNPTGRTVVFKYNYEGELVALHGGSEVRQFEYAVTGQLVRDLLFDTEDREIDCRTHGYRAGRKVRLDTKFGRSIEIVHNMAGEIIQQRFADGTIETFEYNRCGELIRADGPSCQLRFERDQAGRIVRQAQTVNGYEYSIETSYDEMSLRVGRSTSLGHVEIVKRDASCAQIHVTFGDGEYFIQHLDRCGREVARDLVGGGRLESSRDGLGRLVGQVVLAASRSSAGNLDECIQQTYCYDTLGKLVAIRDAMRGDTLYEYDSNHQLVKVMSERASKEAFQYDDAGNIIQAAGTVTREYGECNRILRNGGAQYRWDRRGLLVEKHKRTNKDSKVEVWRYEWFRNDQLRSVTAPDGTVIEFEYDPLGRRVQKRVSHSFSTDGTSAKVVTTRFVWDGAIPVHEVSTTELWNGETFSNVRTYVFDGYVPLSHRDVGTDAPGRRTDRWFYYCPHPIGGSEYVVSSSGQIVWKATRTAWGHTTVHEGAQTTTPVRFEGQYEDNETGLTYNWARYYDPDAGRFISPDPIGIEQILSSAMYADAFCDTQLNLYAYCCNDPVNRSDASGLGEDWWPTRDSSLPLGEPPQGSTLFMFGTNVTGGNPAHPAQVEAVRAHEHEHQIDWARLTPAIGTLGSRNMNMLAERRGFAAEIPILQRALQCKDLTPEQFSALSNQLSDAKNKAYGPMYYIELYVDGKPTWYKYWWNLATGKPQ